MPKTFSILATVAAMSVCAALVYAQEAPPASTSTGLNGAGEPASTPKPLTRTAKKPRVSTVALASLPSSEGQPEPTPPPKKRSLLDWLFGSRRDKMAATPAPAPAVAPTPTPRHGWHKPIGTPAPETGQPATTGKPPKATPSATNEKPGHGPKPVYPSETTPKPAKVTPTPKPEKIPGVTPAPTEPVATPAGKRLPRNKQSTPRPSAASTPTEPAPDADAEAKEKLRFETAESKAKGDPQIKSLKAKADEAVTEEESKAALRAYNKALFEKVKKIDPSVSEWSDRLEAAILKRLSD